MKYNAEELKNVTDRITEDVRRGIISAEQGNVALVRAKRVVIVRGKMMREVRKALNEAVKRGELKHMKKEGHKPEVYFHPDWHFLAVGERAAAEKEVEYALRRYAGFLD